MYVINETAELVKCLCCGEEKYSTRKPFICHRCWRTGKAAEHMQQLTPRAPDAANVCRVVKHFYVDGVCAECGSPDPQRR